MQRIKYYYHFKYFILLKILYKHINTKKELNFP